MVGSPGALAGVGLASLGDLELFFGSFGGALIGLEWRGRRFRWKKPCPAVRLRSDVTAAEAHGNSELLNVFCELLHSELQRIEAFGNVKVSVGK